MQRQDIMWGIGLAAIFLATCLVMAVALGVYLAHSYGENDIGGWIREASKDMPGSVMPLPEMQPYEPAKFLAAGQTPFAHEVPVASAKKH